MKRLSLLLAVLFLSNGIWAQDYLYLKNGKRLDNVRIHEERPTKIVYEQAGSLHDVPITEVVWVKRGKDSQRILLHEQVQDSQPLPAEVAIDSADLVADSMTLPLQNPDPANQVVAEAIPEEEPIPEPEPEPEPEALTDSMNNSETPVPVSTYQPPKNRPILTKVLKTFAILWGSGMILGILIGMTG